MQKKSHCICINSKRRRWFFNVAVGLMKIDAQVKGRNEAEKDASFDAFHRKSSEMICDQQK